MDLIRGSTGWRKTLLALAVGLLSHNAVTAQGTMTIGAGGAAFGGISGSSAGLSGSLAGKGSLISDGMGGFTIYQGRSRSRYFGAAEGPGTVYHVGGATSTVIGDGNGGAIVSGPTGTLRHWGSPLRDVSAGR